MYRLMLTHFESGNYKVLLSIDEGRVIESCARRKIYPNLINFALGQHVRQPQNNRRPCRSAYISKLSIP